MQRLTFLFLQDWSSDWPITSFDLETKNRNKVVKLNKRIFVDLLDSNVFLEIFKLEKLFEIIQKRNHKIT